MKFNEIVKQFQHNVFGNLTTIRSFKDPNKIWFIGAEIQELLGFINLTQVMKDARIKPDEKFVFKKLTNPSFFNEVTTQSVVGFGKYSSSITFISESGLYKLILRSNKPEAEKFADWVTRDVLPTLRQGVENYVNIRYASAEITQHLDVEHQKFESKRVNKIKINTVGVNGTIEYNRNSCLDHSGLTPKSLKALAERNGVPASKRTSGKEVLRLIDMPTASSMSFTDSLVSIGVPYERALLISKTKGKELFKELLAIGVKPKELFM